MNVLTDNAILQFTNFLDKNYHNIFGVWPFCTTSALGQSLIILTLSLLQTQYWAMHYCLGPSGTNGYNTQLKHVLLLIIQFGPWYYYITWDQNGCNPFFQWKKCEKNDPDSHQHLTNSVITRNVSFHALTLLVEWQDHPAHKKSMQLIHQSSLPRQVEARTSGGRKPCKN